MLRSVLAVLVLLVAACGGDDDGTAASGGDQPTGGSPAPGISVDDLAAAAGGAPAVAGVEGVDPPGPNDRTGLPDTSETAATITAADGTVTACCLLVAADDATRQRGLMEVTDLGGYQGMVFVWDEDHSGGFWMRNTPTPLSIAFFDAAGDFVAATDMAPCDDVSDCPVYPSPGSYRFAIEVFQGDLDDLGAGPGSRLTLGGPCGDAGP